MKRDSPKSVGDILAEMVRTGSLGLTLDQAKIWRHWERLLGAHLSKHASPHSVKDKQLRIVVESSVWMHKISYKKWTIIKRINRLAGMELVNDLFFMLAEDKKEPDAPPDSNGSTPE